MILDWIKTDEWMELLVLICLLSFIGDQMCANSTWPKRIAGAGFIMYGILGVLEWEPGSAGDCLVIAFRSLLFSGMVLGLGKILIPAGEFVWRHTGALYLESVRHQREMKRWQEEEERRREAKANQERATMQIVTPPPPPPDPVEVAQKKFDEIKRQLEASPLRETHQQAVLNQAEIEILRAMQKKING